MKTTVTLTVNNACKSFIKLTPALVSLVLSLLFVEISEPGPLGLYVKS